MRRRTYTEPEAKTETFGDACDALALLTFYSPVRRPSRDRIVLALQSDLHAEDCRAPDAYGHEIEVTLHVEARAERCILREATMRYEPVGAVELFDPRVAPGAATRRFDLTPKIDLASPATKEVILRADVALVLAPGAFHFYHSVKPGDRLCGLTPDAPIAGCTYGGTNGTCSNGASEWYKTPEQRLAMCADGD